MFTVTVAPATDHHTPAVPSPTAGDFSSVRVFLACYAATLLPLLSALFALELGWQLLTGSAWPAAVGAVTGWALAVAAWLRRRGWRTGTVVTVTWAPATVLAGLGWLTPAGLVLWGPVSTVLAVALTMASWRHRSAAVG